METSKQNLATGNLKEALKVTVLTSIFHEPYILNRCTRYYGKSNKREVTQACQMDVNFVTHQRQLYLLT